MRERTYSDMAACIPRDEVQNNDELMEDMLSCACGRIFSNPCSLSCGHTMCRDCLLKSKFICTTCGEATDASQDNISVNVLLHSIVAKLYPKHCEVERLKMLAKELEKDGNLQASIEKLTIAKSLKPEDITVLNARGNSLVKAKCYDEGLVDAEKSVELDPTNGYSLFCLGGALSGLKRMDEAFDAYQKCFEFSFNDEDLCEAVSNRMGVLLETSSDAESESTSTLPSTSRKRKLNDFDSQTGCSLPSKMANKELLKIEVSLDDVKCSLCLEILYKPVTTSCGHSFCKSCLMRWLDYNAVCPHCRTPQPEIVAQQSMDVTWAIERFLAEHFPVQYSQINSIRDDEQEKLARVGTDDAVPVPILVCMVAFPSIPCPLNIFEPKYRGMLRECIESGSKRFGTCAPTKDGHADTGTILKVVDVKYSTDGKAIIRTIGENRFKIVSSTTRDDGLMSAFVDYITDDWEKIDSKDVKKVEETCTSVYNKLSTYFDSLKPDAKECITRALGAMPALDANVVEHPNAIGWLWWAIAALPLHDSLKIRFLKSTSFLDRIGSIDRYLQSLLKRSHSC